MVLARRVLIGERLGVLTKMAIAVELFEVVIFAASAAILV
jgi:hypothetical protein